MSLIANFSLTYQVVNLMEINDEDDLYEALKSFVEMMYFRYLAINPKDRKAIICESPFYSTVFRNTLVKVFFEHFDVSLNNDKPSDFNQASKRFQIFKLGARLTRRTSKSNGPNAVDDTNRSSD